MANNGIIEGTNRISIDLVDREENKSGPIATCLGAEYTPVLNDVGQWSARFPANDPILRRLLLKKHFMHIYYDGEIFCYGLTEKWDWELQDDGQTYLVISGRDSLAELDETSMAHWTDDDFDGGNTPWQLIHASDGYNAINGYNEHFDITAWSLAKWDPNDPEEELFPITDMIVYGEVKGESALRILVRIAEYTGESFRLAQSGVFPVAGGFQTVYPKRHIEWLGNFTVSSGVRAVQGAGDPDAAYGNHNICFIQSLSERRDTSRMATKIYTSGAGIGDTQLDLEGIIVGTHVDIPAGFTLNMTDSSISSDDAEAYIGKVISRRLNFKDIKPLFNTDADILEAKKYLFNATLAYLQRNDDIDDTLEYDLEVLQLPAHVKVGMTIRVVYQDARRTINTDFYILGIRKSIASDGLRPSTLTVATINQWRLRDSSNIVAQMEEGQIFGAHNQIVPGTYWINYRELVGDNQIDHMVEFPFWLGNDVVSIIQVPFRFKIEQAIVAVKTYTLAGFTELSEAANTGDENADVTLGVFPEGQLTGDQNADVTLGVFPEGQLTGDENADATTGIIGDPVVFDTGENDIAYGGWETGPALPNAVTGDGTIAGDPHQHEFEHTHSHTHTHPGELVYHQHEYPHQHTMAHSHEYPHQHTMTHAHEYPHQHPSPQHIHGLPSLVETLALELIDPSISYILGDLEFAVNGGGWTSLSTGIPVSGGYSELDITSLVQNPAGLKRPYQEYNVVQVRRSTAAGMGKMAQIRAQIGIRQTIQSVVIYE